jgi:O-antigen ligase
VRRLEVALAVVLVLYAVQAAYSTDPARAIENACFFYVPFALLFVLLAGLEWDARLLRRAAGLVVGLAVAFALVGLAEWATGRLLVPNPKLDAANDLKPYFRVNSLFFDPNVYGRFLAVAMVVLAAVLLWTRRPRGVALAAATLALLWAGLVVSLSQSSFTALLAGLAVVAALRWRVRPVLGAAALVAAAAVAVALLAPGALGLERGSEGSLDRATSGRVDLVEGGLRMAADRPGWGFGSGSYAERFRAREEVRDPDDAVISHTIPLTVAAEQGAIGLVAYLGLLLAAGSLLLGRLRGPAREPGAGAGPVARVAVAAAFAALVVHTLSYAAFLEDPLAWVLLAVGAALWPVRRRSARRVAGPDAPAAVAAPEAAPARV